MIKAGKKYLQYSSFFTVIFFHQGLFAQIASASDQKKETSRQKVDPGNPVMIANSLKCFDNIDKNSLYSITLCADVPKNDRPDKMLFAQEPGHVFLIFTKSNGADSVNFVFGFYPLKPVFIFFLGYVKSSVHENSGREYDASIKKELNADDFSALLRTAVGLSRKKYHLRKYNCYDYALELFNSIPGGEKIPVHHLRLNFLAGRFGSPCGLYQDLKLMKEKKPELSSQIFIGNRQAPQGCKI